MCVYRYSARHPLTWNVQLVPGALPYQSKYIGYIGYIGYITKQLTNRYQSETDVSVYSLATLSLKNIILIGTVMT